MRKTSLFLAFLLALTAVVPVRTAAAQTVMQSEIALVDVTVPATGRVILNPYGLPVEVDGGTTTEQIASQTMPITNNGVTPVVVSASVTGRIAAQSSMAFVTAPPPAGTTEKEIFMYAEFQDGDGQWSEGYSGGDNQLLISKAASQTKEVLTLDAASEGVFRLFGATAVSPADPWSGADEVSVVFTFTFVPVIEPLEVTAEEDSAQDPTEDPTGEPAGEPVEEPTGEPAGEPVEEPTGEPAGEPVEEPSGEPTGELVEEPSEDTSKEPIGDLPPTIPNTPSGEENLSSVPSDSEEQLETHGETDPSQPETGIL